ncbi:MAG: lipid A deacylase LpxR family protein [Spongiibacteraceae bacterium]
MKLFWSLGLLCFFCVLPVKADTDWVSVTLDNDLLLNSDGGYTNGLFLSLYDTGNHEEKPQPSWLLKPLMWTVSGLQHHDAINIFTLGQTMITPQDITIKNPPEDEVPYSGLLFFNNSYLLIGDKYVDKISTSVGFVGPLSMAEISQKTIHKLVSSDQPEGWDTQIKNELVFQFSRGRAQRLWVADNSQWDFVGTNEISLGTISSGLNTGGMLRYGTQLQSSYGTALMDSARITNPSVIGVGWNFYLGMNLEYIFNQIFADGNTFRDSRSIDYEHLRLGVTVGFSYTRQRYSLTFAISDLDVIDSELRDLTQFGRLTLAYKL